MLHRTTTSISRAVLGAAGFGLALSVASPPLGAQVTLAEFGYSGAGTAMGFGGTIAGLGDIDGDGHADFVTSAPSGGAAGAGVVQILSGADHSVIREWNGDVANDRFGASVDSAGDVDGDGLDDVVVGAPSFSSFTGVVRVYSSATGALLYDYPALAVDESFGWTVAGVGDLDHDGRGDFVAATPFGHTEAGELNAGYVRVFSGADGHEFARLRGVLDEQFGYCVRPAGDFDADGTPDVAVTTNREGLGLDVHVQVYSGAWIVDRTLPALLLDVTDPAFGASSVDAAGDIDQDGWDDLLVGLPDLNAPQGPGGFRVISGRDHSALLDWLGADAGHHVGANVSGLGDLDQDGYPDLLVGSTDGNPFWGPPVQVFSGHDGSVLYTCKASTFQAPFGAALAGVGDVNADGFLDWAVGTPWVATIKLFSPVGIWNDLGHGLAGTAGVPSLSGAGLLLGGEATSIALAGALTSHPVVLVIGLTRIDQAFKGGVMVPHPDLLHLSVTDASGGRAWSTTWPQPASTQSFYFQAWLKDPQGVEGWAASNGLRAQSP